jgi:catechol 2,3-dioxygenase-like lactoylglutathione lyase family enzyme
MKIEHLDHLILTVKSIDRTCAFYTQVLGMEVNIFKPGHIALAFGPQQIRLHEHGREFEPKAAKPTPGGADFCLVTKTPLLNVIEHLRSNNVEIIEGPLERVGAQGLMDSVYFRDPDQNLIEVSNYKTAS